MNLPTMTALSARVSVAAVLLLALSACGDDEPGVASDPPASSSPSSDAPEPTPTTTPTPAPTPSAAPEVIAYAGGESPGMEVTSRADAGKLEGAPPEFQTFIGDLAQKNADASTCEDGYVGVTVDAVSTAGYAVGGVNDCGGYAAMWAVVDGSWKEIAGTQEAWDCAVLKKYRVPSDLLLGDETCYDYDGDQKEHPYHQA